MSGLIVDGKLTGDALKALKIVRQREDDGEFTFSSEVAAFLFECFYRCGEQKHKEPIWRSDIENAPKADRSHTIIAYGNGPGFYCCVFVASWDEQNKSWVEAFKGWSGEGCAVQAWMPLPCAPAKT